MQGDRRCHKSEKAVAETKVAYLFRNDDKTTGSSYFSAPSTTVSSLFGSSVNQYKECGSGKNISPSFTGNLLLRRDEALMTEWKIDNFLNTPDSVAKSPTFNFSSFTWYLELRSSDDAREWLSLRLCSMASGGSSQIVKFELGKKEFDDDACFKQAFIRKYEGEAKYGIEYFTKTSELVERKDEKMASESVTIVCSLRSLKYPVENSKGFAPGLSGMLFSKKHSDMCIHVKDQQFQAHKVILAASSEVFSAMFDHEMSENNSGVLKIEDSEPELFKDFLHFLYTGRTDITDSNVYDLYTIGHKYCVEDLIFQCVGYMICYLSVDNLTDVATLGHRYSDNDVAIACSIFFEQNVREILLTPQWKLLMKDNYLVAYKLLEYIASRITVKKKEL